MLLKQAKCHEGRWPEFRSWLQFRRRRRLAMQFAREGNQTLIGFIRPPSFNVYSHVERMILD